jgi:mannan endo-1,4-beta-mannosidase
MRVLSVFAALVVMAGLPVAATKLLPLRHHAETTDAQQVKHFPRTYVGIVSENVPVFDKLCKCRPNAAIHYVSMADPVSMFLPKLMLGAGAVPVMEIEPYGIPLSSIIAGRGDEWLTKYAKALLSLKAPIVVSFAPEANGSWYDWGYTHVQPKVFIQAWRHVVTVFRKAGAGRRIKFAWIMNHWFPHSETLRLLWPGRTYVDMMGIDGYFKDRRDDFARLFLPTIRDMRKLSDRPILISETAAGPTAGKVRAVQDLVANMTAYHLAGFIWFDIRQPGHYIHQDWRIETERRAMAAYRHAVQRYASPVD